MICNKCKQNKPTNEFHLNRQTKRGNVSWCKMCVKLYQNGRKNIASHVHKQYYEANAEKIRSQRRGAYLLDKDKPDSKARTYSLNKYGLSIAEYTAMLDMQNGVCAICGQEETGIIKKTNKRKKLAVDHCHKNGKVRGLLCSLCNSGLGRFKDNIQSLKNAIEYLNKHNE